MTTFVAKRVKFRNGERHSVLSRPGGLPVHEATLYLARYRRRGRAANTIHGVCRVLALLYRELVKAGIDLLQRLRQGQFLTVPELNRIADAAQYWAADLSNEDAAKPRASNVIDIKRIRMRRTVAVGKEAKAVGVGSQATRLRYIGDYLEFLATYVGATLPAALGEALAQETERSLKAFRAEVPQVPRRRGAFEGGPGPTSQSDSPGFPRQPMEATLRPSAKLADCCPFARDRYAARRTARPADSRPWPTHREAAHPPMGGRN
jgi:hypothetical protein